MKIPQGAQKILQRLNDHGFQAYAVGGCVRDSLLGTVPEDWDICTSALPKETEDCFSDLRVVETGLKHGTVTVISEGVPYEITTFRSDGNYLDHRRPQQVSFVRSLREDLLRRDFTINAMAAGLDGTIQDPFDGQQDLKNGVIRCVGEPEQRFSEDALRILRGLRFASRLGFSIAPETAEAMRRKKLLLHYVSEERIYKELSGILMGSYASQVLRQFSDIVAVVLPEIIPSMGFQQHSPFHNRDVWQHTLEALEKSRPELRIRWALLLHDLGKPDCFTVDEHGTGHFYGHPQTGAGMAESILKRLKFDNYTIGMVKRLVQYHDYRFDDSLKNLRRFLSKAGADIMPLLFVLMRADIYGQSSYLYEDKLERLAVAQSNYKKILEEKPAVTIKDMKINGNDLINAGIGRGKIMGDVLKKLLDVVIDDPSLNEHETLMSMAGSIYREISEKNV